MQNLNALRDEVFAINKANGWHEQERSFGELIALVHSEVSEALEDYRNGKAVNEVWYEYKYNGYTFIENVKAMIDEEDDNNEVLGKPCGIPSELADIVIRILDICGLNGWDIEYMYRTPKFLPNPKGFVDQLADIHLYTSFAYYYDSEEEDPETALDHLTVVIILVERICRDNSIDLESIIRQKLEYNKTRGYKHGGKLI